MDDRRAGRRGPGGLPLRQLLGGGNAVGVRVSNRELDPTWGAGLRFVLAAALLGAALCFAEAAVLVRRFPSVHPITADAIRMTSGAAILLALTLLRGEELAVPEREATWAAIAYMVVLGSGPVFVLDIVVLRLWSASRAAYTFVLTPVVTVFLSAWIDEEPIGLALVLGGVLVLAGVYAGALRRRPAA